MKNYWNHWSVAFLISLFLGMWIIGHTVIDITDSQNENAEKIHAVKTHIVTIDNMEFNPSELKIHKGDKVKWVNKGIVEHDVTDFPREAWTSGKINIRETWERTFNKSARYYCSIHPTMKGKIIVGD